MIMQRSAENSGVCHNNNNNKRVALLTGFPLSYLGHRKYKHDRTFSCRRLAVIITARSFHLQHAADGRFYRQRFRFLRCLSSNDSILHAASLFFVNKKRDLQNVLI